jgi:hypothetical protein
MMIPAGARQFGQFESSAVSHTPEYTLSESETDELVVEMAQSSSEHAYRPSSDFVHLKASAATGLQEHACSADTGRLVGKRPIIPMHVRTGFTLQYRAATCKAPAEPTQ